MLINFILIFESNLNLTELWFLLFHSTDAFDAFMRRQNERVKLLFYHQIKTLIMLLLMLMTYTKRYRDTIWFLLA